MRLGRPHTPLLVRDYPESRRNYSPTPQLTISQAATALPGDGATAPGLRRHTRVAPGRGGRRSAVGPEQGVVSGDRRMYANSLTGFALLTAGVLGLAFEPGLNSASAQPVKEKDAPKEKHKGKDGAGPK